MCSSKQDGGDMLEAFFQDIFDSNSGEQQQPPNAGQQNESEWMKMKLTAVENKCALLEQKLENMKLNGLVKREKDKKVIEQLKNELVATQQKLEKQEKTANEKFEKMRSDIMKSVEQKIAKEISERMGRAKQSVDKNKEQGTSNKFLFCNPKKNKWEKANVQAQITISADGLVVTYAAVQAWSNVFAAHPFTFARGHVCYYEVTTDYDLCIGLSKKKHQVNCVGYNRSSYSIRPCSNINFYYYASDQKQIEWPAGAIKPELNKQGVCNVYGCGMVMRPNKTRSIFFTLNGTLLGREIPLGNDFHALNPAVSMYSGATFRTNFGDDPTNGFAYDIAKCPVFNAKTN